MHPEFDGPEQALYLLELYWSISEGRFVSGFGASPLTHLDIASWCWLKGTRLSHFEMDVIRALDKSYITIVSEKADQNVSGPRASEYRDSD